MRRTLNKVQQMGGMRGFRSRFSRCNSTISGLLLACRVFDARPPGWCAKVLCPTNSGAQYGSLFLVHALVFCYDLCWWHMCVGKPSFVSVCMACSTVGQPLGLWPSRAGYSDCCQMTCARNASTCDSLWGGYEEGYILAAFDIHSISSVWSVTLQCMAPPAKGMGSKGVAANRASQGLVLLNPLPSGCEPAFGHSSRWHAP